MTEAVPLVSYFMKRHCLVLPASERWEYLLRGRLFPSGLCLSAISRVVWAWPMGLNGDGKNVQTLWWAELDRLHSMTRAHPPLAIDTHMFAPLGTTEWRDTDPTTAKGVAWV